MSLVVEKSSSARSRPKRFSATLLKVPSGQPVILCRLRSALETQWRTERGKRPSSIKKPATFSGEMRPCWRRYSMMQSVDWSSADHWMMSIGVPTAAVSGSRMKYFTSRIREVLSARSR